MRKIYFKLSLTIFIHKILCKLGIHKVIYLPHDDFKEVPYCRYCEKILNSKW